MGGAERRSDRVTRAQRGASSQTLTQAPAITSWCLAEPGRTHAVYIRGTREVVTLRVGAGTRWQITRFDPLTGKRERIDELRNGDALRLSAPDEQDWLFVVRAS